MQAKTKQTKVDGESYKENLKKTKTNQKQHLNSYIDTLSIPKRRCNLIPNADCISFTTFNLRTAVILLS